jgi:hypothetical protein
MEQLIYVGRIKQSLTPQQQKELLEFVFAQVIREAIRLYYKYYVPPKGFRQILLVLPKKPRGIAQDIVHEANKFAISLVEGSMPDVSRKEMHKAIFALILTSAAEIINHCAVYTNYYASSVLGRFAEGFFKKYTKSLSEQSRDEIQYDNYPQLANIVRGFGEGDLIEVLKIKKR